MSGVAARKGQPNRFRSRAKREAERCGRFLGRSVDLGPGIRAADIPHGTLSGPAVGAGPLTDSEAVELHQLPLLLHVQLPHGRFAMQLCSRPPAPSVGRGSSVHDDPGLDTHRWRETDAPLPSKLGGEPSRPHPRIRQREADHLPLEELRRSMRHPRSAMAPCVEASSAQNDPHSSSSGGTGRSESPSCGKPLGYSPTPRPAPSTEARSDTTLPLGHGEAPAVLTSPAGFNH